MQTKWWLLEHEVGSTCSSGFQPLALVVPGADASAASPAFHTMKASMHVHEKQYCGFSNGVK
jgi:hypothetical protein